MHTHTNTLRFDRNRINYANIFSDVFRSQVLQQQRMLYMHHIHTLVYMVFTYNYEQELDKSSDIGRCEVELKFTVHYSLFGPNSEL